MYIRSARVSSHRLKRTATTMALFLAAAILLLSFAPPVAAQTSSTLAAPTLYVNAGHRATVINWYPGITGAARYELQSATTPGDWQPLGGNNLTDVGLLHGYHGTWEDGSPVGVGDALVVDATYYYRVRAVNAAEETGLWSEVVSVVIPDQMSPPTLTAQAGANEVLLSWTLIPGARAVEIVSWAAKDGQSAATLLLHRLEDEMRTDTTYRHTGLTAGETYHYQIHHLDNAGIPGKWSDVVSAIIPLPAPTLRAQPAAIDAAIDLSWNAIEGAAHYVLCQLLSVEDPFCITWVPEVSRTNYQVVGLGYEVPHSYQVRAVNQASTGAWSNIASATPSFNLDRITAPTARLVADRTVEISWQAVSGADQYILWAIESTQVDESAWQPDSEETLTTTDTTYRHTGLTVGKWYFYWVRGVNKAGQSGSWTQVPPLVIYDFWVNPALTAQGVEGAVELRWDAVEGAGRYELFWSADGASWQQIGGDALTATSFEHANLTPGQTYRYRICAVGHTTAGAGQPVGPGDGGAIGPWSATMSATVPLPLPAVPTLTAHAAVGAVDLQWNAVEGAVRYELYGAWNQESWQRLDDGALTTISYTHNGLAAGTTAHYVVRAVNATGGKSDWASAQATVTEEPLETPTPTPVPSPTPSPVPAPGTLSKPILTVQAGTTAIEVHWNAIEGAVRYELYAWWNDAETGWQRLDDGALTTTTYTHTDITVDTDYYYIVRAVNAAGKKSDWADHVSTRVTE